MIAPLARAVSVDKSFGAVHAVKSASLDLFGGRIHAVCGENGAGKSTLLKVVAGMIVPDRGEIDVGGARLVPHTPREAIRRGVGMVLQHFALIPVFTALENVVLGAEPTSSFGVLDLDAARVRVRKIAEELGVELPLDARVEELGIGDRQRLEIARALFRDASLLILDEPTAVLTKVEASALYATLRRLADSGKAIVVVTHKMDEVALHADVVSVMRRGELVFTRPIDRAGNVAAQVDEVAAAIMGTEHAAAAIAKTAVPLSKDALPALPALTMRGVRYGRALEDLSLTVGAGEVVGIAGVEGNGQRELVALLAGDVAPEGGTIEGGPLAIVREDRQTEGLVLDASLRDNVVLGELDHFTRFGGWIDAIALEREAEARIVRSGAPRDLDRPARTLSGGNQQKVVVARALARIAPKGAHVLIAAQPTRGVDFAAAKDIHGRLREAADGGAGVLVLSADLDELRTLSDRILVLARGRIVAEMPNDASDEELGRKMLGIEVHS